MDHNSTLQFILGFPLLICTKFKVDTRQRFAQRRQDFSWNSLMYLDSTRWVVAAVLGCWFLHWIVSSAFCLLWLRSEESRSYWVCQWISSLISGFQGGREWFHWHVVVGEFIVQWKPRCRTGNGCVHVNNLLAHTSSLFYHIHSLGTNWSLFGLCGLNKSLWCGFCSVSLITTV